MLQCSAVSRYPHRFSHYFKPCVQDTNFIFQVLKVNIFFINMTLFSFIFLFLQLTAECLFSYLSISTPFLPFLFETFLLFYSRDDSCADSKILNLRLRITVQVTLGQQELVRNTVHGFTDAAYSLLTQDLPQLTVHQFFFSNNSY